MFRAALLALLLLVLMPAGSTFALSCATLLTAEEAYAEYDGIVVGHVNTVKKTGNGEKNSLQITVKQSFKTITEQTITLSENSTWGALNGPSQAGEDYLFFLRQTNGQWENPLCSPSAKVADASSELAFLQDKEIPVHPTAAAVNIAENTRLNAWNIAFLAGIGVLAGVAIFRYSRRRD